MSELEIAVIAVCIILGAGAIAYAGLRTATKRKPDKVGPDASTGDTPAIMPSGRHADDGSASDGGGDAGGD